MRIGGGYPGQRPDRGRAEQAVRTSQDALRRRKSDPPPQGWGEVLGGAAWLACVGLAGWLILSL